MLEHSKNYEKVKEYYIFNRWTIDKVRDAVKHNWITAIEFEEITGESY